MSADLLMLSPYWPPHGGPGVQRIVKFARYLPEFGVSPRVVTRANRETEDISLIAEVAGVALREAAHLPLQRMGRKLAGAASANSGNARRFAKLKGVRDWVQVPDHAVSWVPFAIRAATRWTAEQPATALFSTSPYHSTHLAGMALQRKLGIPWIAEFRDPWASDPFTHYPTPLHRRLNARLEQAVLTRADRVVVVSEAMRRDFSQRYPHLATPVDVIYNGYDEADFQLPSPPQGSPWTIRHMGTFYPDRKPDAFLHGLARFIAADPSRRPQFRVEFYGNLHGDVEARLRGLVETLGLDNIHFFPYVAHREAVGLLQSSHALLLVPGPGDMQIPGKVFEYLAAARPILAMAPRPSGIDEVWTRLPENPLRAEETAVSVAAALERLASALAAGRDAELCAPRPQVATFSRRGAAQKLAELVTALRPTGVAG